MASGASSFGGSALASASTASSSAGSCWLERATLTARARPSTSVPSTASAFFCSSSEAQSTKPKPLERRAPNLRWTMRAVWTVTPALAKTALRPSSSSVKGRLATWEPGRGQVSGVETGYQRKKENNRENRAGRELRLTKTSVLDGSPVGAARGGRGARGALGSFGCCSPASASSIRAAAPAALDFFGGRVALGAEAAGAPFSPAAPSETSPSAAFFAPRRRGGRWRETIVSVEA